MRGWWYTGNLTLNTRKLCALTTLLKMSYCSRRFFSPWFLGYLSYCIRYEAESGWQETPLPSSVTRENIYISTINYLGFWRYSFSRLRYLTVLGRPRYRFIGSCEPLNMDWELNLNPLEKQEAFLITKSTL